MTMKTEFTRELKNVAMMDASLRDAAIKLCAEKFEVAEDVIQDRVKKIIENLKHTNDGNGIDKEEAYRRAFEEYAKLPFAIRCDDQRLKAFAKTHGGTYWELLRQLREYDQKQRKVTLICAKDIKPESTDWLWNGWLARAKIEILAGTKGDGKSTLAFSFSAIISCGGQWPDGTIAKIGRVLIWSGEDDAGDTIAPRLIAMGANMANIHIISTVTECNGEKRGFDPSTDLEALESAIAELGGVDLLIIDPFVSAVKRGKNSHNNAETRQGLQHVKDFASEHNCAVLGIHHLSKGTAGHEPIDRVTGSVAFTALPRIVLMTVKRKEDENDGPPRMLVRAASNIGPSGGAFGYNIESTILHEPPIETTQIKWLEGVKGEARDLIADAEEVKDRKQCKIDKACDFLREILKDGFIPSTEVFERAEQEGHSVKTINRAKKELNIRPFKCGDKWVWALPGGSGENDPM